MILRELHSDGKWDAIRDQSFEDLDWTLLLPGGSEAILGSEKSGTLRRWNYRTGAWNAEIATRMKKVWSLEASPGRLNRDFLQALSTSTGGFMFTEGNESDAAITQMLRENGSYYLIGYSRSTPSVEGKFRRVEVRVNRPGTTVRARSGYYEPRESKAGATTSSPASDALASLMPKADVAMRVAAAPLAVAGKREAAVAIAVGVQQPARPSQGERLVDDVEMQAKLGIRIRFLGLQGVHPPEETAEAPM